MHGLPWGVNISEGCVYLQETIPIIDGFNMCISDVELII